jgi:hypothetical protein
MKMERRRKGITAGGRVKESEGLLRFPLRYDDSHEASSRLFELQKRHKNRARPSRACSSFFTWRVGFFSWWADDDRIPQPRRHAVFGHGFWPKFNLADAVSRDDRRVSHARRAKNGAAIFSKMAATPPDPSDAILMFKDAASAWPWRPAIRPWTPGSADISLILWPYSARRRPAVLVT